MLIRFTKNALNPRKRTYGGFDFYEGKVYDLPDTEANYHIQKGEAVKVAGYSLRDELERNRKIGLVRKPQPKVDPDPHDVMRLIKFKPTAKQDNVFKALKIQPRPEDKIRIPTLNQAEVKALKNKETSKAFRDFFKQEKYKDITARELVDMLLTIYDYAIDTNDNNTIIKVSKDLTNILKLVRLIKGEND